MKFFDFLRPRNKIIEQVRARGILYPIIDQNGNVVAYGTSEETADLICKLWNNARETLTGQ